MSSSSGLTFKLHPLVILNIADHHTRVKAQSGGASGRPPRVFGCVLGVQSGRTVEIFNSFELKYDPALDCLDRQFLETKQEQCELVYLSSSLSDLLCPVSSPITRFLRIWSVTTPMMYQPFSKFESSCTTS